MHADWLTPQWPAPAGVRAVFTTRQGGVSGGPYSSMNLGDHVGDLAASVSANRRRLQEVTATRAVFLRQVHGHAVASLGRETPDGQEADACVTVEPGLACTIMVADCLPVLFACANGRAVAAAHAGWRGLAGSAGEGGVLEATLSALGKAARTSTQAGSAETLAWLGPCIGPRAFEVGPEVKAAFEAAQPGCGAMFVAQTNGKFLADLPGLARLRLAALGITRVYGNDGTQPWCTVANPSRFFSHRRDAGARGNGFATTGRMAACIWMTGT